MEYIAITLAGIFCGALFVSAISSEKINKLNREKNSRDVYIETQNKTVSKYYRIETIIAKADKNKENYFETIAKIKNVISERR